VRAGHNSPPKRCMPGGSADSALCGYSCFLCEPHGNALCEYAATRANTTFRDYRILAASGRLCGLVVSLSGGQVHASITHDRSATNLTSTHGSLTTLTSLGGNSTRARRRGQLGPAWLRRLSYHKDRRAGFVRRDPNADAPRVLPTLSAHEKQLPPLRARHQTRFASSPKTSPVCEICG
jgi:hypothetical protein